MVIAGRRGEVEMEEGIREINCSEKIQTNKITTNILKFSNAFSLCREIISWKVKLLQSRN